MKKDKTAHIAHYLPDGTTGYAIFDAASPILCGDLLRVSAPAMIMIKPVTPSKFHGRVISFTVSDPDLHLVKPPLAGLGDTVIMSDEDAGKESSPSTLSIELKGIWLPHGPLPQNVVVYPAEGEATTLQVICRDGLETEVMLESESACSSF